LAFALIATCAGDAFVFMPKKLKRYYGKGDLHYITFGCYHRFKLLGSAQA
jgi:hypothetical protein